MEKSTVRIDKAVSTILRKGEAWAEYLIDVHFINPIMNDAQFTEWLESAYDAIMLQTPYPINNLSVGKESWDSGGEEPLDVAPSISRGGMRLVSLMEIIFDISLDRADLEIFGKLLELVIGGADNVKAVSVTWRDSTTE